MKQTGPKRHHFVPKLLLRRFSDDPTAKNPMLWRLDKMTGRPSKCAVNNEAVIGHFNRLENVPSLDPDAVERDLAMIEGVCKPSLDKAIERQALDVDDFHLITMFSVLQHHRTPRWRQWNVELLEHMERLVTELNISTGAHIREFLETKRGGGEVTDEAVNEMRAELLQSIRKGRLIVKATSDHEVLGMFVAATDVAKEIAVKMSFACLHSATAEFILSDHPVCIYDRLAPVDRGAGWLSSPASEVAFPISRDTCLFFRPGPPGFMHVNVPGAVVTDINLRSYAAAEWSIYGSAQRWVQETRTAARRDRAKVAQYVPRKPHFIVYEQEEGEAEPSSVEVYEPRERTVRGFRPTDRVTRPIGKRPMTARLRREWSRLRPDDAQFPLDPSSGDSHS